MPQRDDNKVLPGKTPRGGETRAEREARSAEALRENLKRRKQQARMRMGEGEERHDDEGKGSGGGA